ncbi:MAG: type II toxin-antitoxin system HicA family toxin [Alphaproteobacteria bacterium]|nr:type II toxin-antitoxin system HicA family toxin [Alphaproteobacteria bacterium]
MRYSEFRKWLKDHGCTFDESRGKGGHITIYFWDKKTVMPFHGNKEIGKGLVHAIKKQLGMK